MQKNYAPDVFVLYFIIPYIILMASLFFKILKYLKSHLGEA